MKQYKLALKNAEYRFDGANIFRLPDLTAGFEKMLVIKGRIGSGKTVLLKTLGGVAGTASGEVSLMKRIGSGRAEEAKGYFVHSQPEFNFVTGVVGDELDFAGIPRDLFTPYLKRNVNELSGGELKKLSVMMALLASRDVVLFDEPLDMLDDTQCGIMAEYIAEKSAGKPVVIATHDSHFDRYADGVIRIDDKAAEVSGCTQLRPAGGYGPSLLSVENFSTHIEGKEFSKISMESRAGEIVCLFGMNGSGKTLFTRAAAGIGRQDSTGGIGWHIERRLRGFCMQFPEQMVYQETIFQEIADTAGKENTDAVLDVLGWRGREQSSPFSISDGEKRTMYLISLLKSKQYCLFDEPFAGLDAQSASFIVENIIKARNEGKGILYTANRASHTAFADTIIKI